MYTFVENRKIIVSILTVFGFAVIVSLVSPIVPALATGFEVGTQFGISHLTPVSEGDSSTSFTYVQVPSGTFLDIGTSPTSLYVTWFPGKQFAIGPEFSFGRISIYEEYSGETETTSITSLYLGGRVSYFLRNHTVSTPYLLGRVSHTIFNSEDSFFLGGDGTLIPN